MELSVVDQRLTLSTTWKGLHIPTSTGQSNFPLHLANFRFIDSFGVLTDLADQDVDPPPERDKMFATVVSIKGLLKFLSSHLVGGTAIACEYRHHLYNTRFVTVSGMCMSHALREVGICQRHCVIAYVYIGMPTHINR